MSAPARHPRPIGLALLVVAAIPSAAHAQSPAASFDDLRRLLKNGQTIVVTDTSGHRVKGTLRDVTTSPPSLAIAAPVPQTFAADAIAEIRTTDRVWNGALIGAGIGSALALWDYAIDPSEPGNGPIFMFAIGTGAAIGAGIDALRSGRVVYRAGARARTLAITPIATRRLRGVQLSVRF